MSELFSRYAALPEVRFFLDYWYLYVIGLVIWLVWPRRRRE